MKLPILESTIIKLEILGTSLTSIFAVLSPDQHLSTVGWALLGSVLGGYVFTFLSKPLTVKDWILRWIANVCAGIVTGLVVATYYSDSIPDVPLPFFTMLCSFLVGPLTVIAIPIGIPKIKEFLICSAEKILSYLKK